MLVLVVLLAIASAKSWSCLNPMPPRTAILSSMGRLSSDRNSLNCCQGGYEC